MQRRWRRFIASNCTELALQKKLILRELLKSIGGFDGFDIRLDNMLQENDFYLYDVFDNCEGTATREAGLHKGLPDKIHGRQCAPYSSKVPNLRGFVSISARSATVVFYGKMGLHSLVLGTMQGIVPTLLAEKNLFCMRHMARKTSILLSIALYKQ